MSRKPARWLGYSRLQFDGIRRNFQTYGGEGLVDRLPARRDRIAIRPRAPGHSMADGRQRRRRHNSPTAD